MHSQSKLRPAHLRGNDNEINVAQFRQASVVDRYHLRLPYPSETFEILKTLLIDTPYTVLDVGTGTGEIAREMVKWAGRVDAVDASASMIQKGQTLPDGDHPNLRWLCGKAEEVELQPPYSLIVGADSLHWMDWPVIFPKFARLLSPNGVVAIVTRGELSPAWNEGLVSLIRQYSTQRNYEPYNLVDLLTQQGLFETLGEKTTSPVSSTQSIEDYIASFHSRSSLSLDALTVEAATNFDNELRQLVMPFTVDGQLTLATEATIQWGRPRQNL